MNRDSAASVSVADDGTLRLTGRIGYANADALLPKGRNALASGKVKRIDLSGLQGSDSATLALLLDWAAQAKRRNQLIAMTGAPEGLRALARLANAEALLNLS